MSSKKRRKRYEEELSLFMQTEAERPPAPEESDAAYSAFRRHIEEHVQGETRAFHELRSTAEHKVPLDGRPSPAAGPHEPGKKRAKEPSPRAAEAKKAEAPHPAPRQAPSHSVPIMTQASSARAAGGRGSHLLINALLGASLLTLGGLGYQSWLQWNHRSASEIKARGALRARVVKDRGTSIASKVAESPCGGAVVAANGDSPPASSAVAAPTSIPDPKISRNPSAAAETGPSSEAIPSAGRATAIPSKEESRESAASGERKQALLVQAGEVRRGPSKQYEILDILPAGSVIDGQLTSDQQWLRLDGGRFVALAQSEAIETSQDVGWSERWVAARSANIRALPALTAAVSRKVNQGEALRVQMLNPRWARVEGGGFIYTAILREEAPTAALRLPATMRVSRDQATIYSGPGIDFPPTGIYFKNHQVEALEMRDGWLRVGSKQFMKLQDLEQTAQTARSRSQQLQ